MKRGHAALMALGFAALLLGGMGVVVRSHQLHQLPGAAGPGRIEICGRTFIGPGTRYTTADMTLRQGAKIGSVKTWSGSREVWGRHVTIGGLPGCGTGVYLRTGSDEFRGYALSGGP
jgi:hypothetical protein